jgi:MATE family multidrug resistance protein
MTPGELRPMLRLALPVIAAEVGWISMGLVDTLMVGRLGPAAIGAVGTGSILYMAVMVVGFGTLYSLDTFVSQSFGAGRIDECHRWLFAGVQVATVLAVVLGGLSILLVWQLPALGLHRDVLVLIRPYLTQLLWSTPPLLAYAVFRRYLQAMHVVRPVMYALVVANLNLGANWVLIYGHLGFRVGCGRIGLVDGARACGARRVPLRGDRPARARNPSGLHDVPFVWDRPRNWRIVRLGVPAAGQIVLEVGVFAAASALAGRIAPRRSRRTRSCSTSCRSSSWRRWVSARRRRARGNAVGRRDPAGARRSGWTALALTTALMCVSATVLAVAPWWLMRLPATRVSFSRASVS